MYYYRVFSVCSAFLQLTCNKAQMSLLCDRVCVRVCVLNVATAVYGCLFACFIIICHWLSQCVFVCLLRSKIPVHAIVQ